MPDDLLKLDTARMRLARIWFIGSGLVFGILLVQSVTRAYGGRLEDVWAWFSTTILPTLALMITVFKANAVVRRKKEQPDEQQDEVTELFARRLPYQVALTLSIIYLVTILCSVLATPAIVTFYAGEPARAAHIIGSAEHVTATADNFTKADALLLSHRWLGILQTLVISALGALFFTQHTDA